MDSATGKNKKILINATYAGGNPTGIGVFTTELVTRLVKMRPDLFYLLGLNDFLPGYNDKSIISNYMSPDNGARGHVCRILWSQTALALDFKKSGCRLLFSTLPEAPVIIKNKIVVVHDIIPVRYKDEQTRMRHYFKYIVPHILNTSRHLVFDSEYSRADVFDYYGLKDIPYTVIPGGYDNFIFHPAEKGYIKKKYGYDRYFFYVGEMRPYKNLANAVRAFGRSGLRDHLFIIAGRKDIRYYPALKDIAEELDLGRSVIFTGYLPQDELPYFYNDAAALFFPSRYEGFGLPLLESMATGTPVITSALTSIPEVCGDAAIYVDPDDISQMASALRSVAMDDNLRRAYSEKSLKRAAMFSWENTAGKYISLFLEVLNEL